MELLGFDLTELAGLWLAAASVMMLMLICTVRFAAVPLLDAWTRARRRQEEQQASESIGLRLAAIETRLETLTQTVNESFGAPGPSRSARGPSMDHSA